MRLLIIGAGPGGYETAVEAAKRGIETVIVSDGPVGGTCLNEGCIPTKTFCHFTETLSGGVEDLGPLQEKKNSVLDQLRSGVEGLLSNKLITLVYGKAKLAGPHSIEVDGVRYDGDALIIATGSVSASLPIEGVDLPGVVTSREMLSLASTPERLCVIGGGVIGLEFASIFQSLGSRVSVVEYCPNILPRFDVDLAKRLKQSLSKRGISIEVGAQVTGITRQSDVLSVNYLKKDREFSVEADLVLMAVGRRANLDSLNLADAGIGTTRRGIAVDGNFQTNVPGVYAIGDVNGGMMLAHVAAYQGLRALNHICGQADDIDFSQVPAAVFTVPEVAYVGKTEEECEAEGIRYKALKSFYRANGKALSMDASEGYVKILAEEQSGRIIGAHIMGAHASDLVHEVAVMLKFGATVSQMQSVIHAHPCLSEIIQSALRTF